MRTLLLFKSYSVTSALIASLFVFQPMQSWASNTPYRIQEDREPEAATGITVKQAVTKKKFMVATANPYATKIGYKILEKGGSAIDAAIAVQLALTLVEPQSSGIGGGAFILHWDKKNQHLTTFDGREVAPKAATPDIFLDKNDKAVPWIKAVVGGRSVGVPGVLAALKKAHDKYGKLPWKDLFTDVITLAEQGFIVSPRLQKLVEMQYNPGITELDEIREYFFPDGHAVKAGDKLKNKKLAKVYRSLSEEGISPFYQGWIAKSIVKAVQSSPVAPGKLSTEDLASYQAKEVQPVCGSYRDYRICGMAPPSSGGVAVLQILKQLEPFDMAKLAFEDAQTVHLFTQSSRLAFADRARYIADDGFVNVPTSTLVSEQYLNQRSKLINIHQDMGKATAGEVESLTALADNVSIELPSTSHISIVDADGNAISMTTSIEMAFGSAVMAEGFILNNQLTDFSLAPSVNGQLVANRLEANKRPRSSMAPTMVFKGDDLTLVVGSPGGSRIINYVAQTIMGVLDWGLDPQQAINMPKVTNRNRITTLEKGTSIVGLATELKAKGHEIAIRDLNSGIHAIEVKKSSLVGGADPRREGTVMGQ
ncbi:gamma-glutamyltransferase [Thalassotalea sp. 1_MG-2023]|uniref:gamma-glutamyltransferase n=1 Tax=Thalassotalea sp. 1_MG-2023 TaxID=3062680 RepID=UPI0026E2D8AE|nr:gamma-glutamyltransferase [Thalassotalea sp. 1_MG-2023]MDO6428300.1 gamma-glutamyltransferase [Thalassotalea sp. 1_MG-2023]